MSLAPERVRPDLPLLTCYPPPGPSPRSEPANGRRDDHLNGRGTAERSLDRRPVPGGSLRPILALALIACLVGSARAQSPEPSVTCPAVPADSVRATIGVVYRSCAVDEPARLRRVARPSSAFTAQFPCASVRLEFVVGPDGRPIVATARVLGTTADAFAEQVVRSLGRWRYRPARRGDVPVAQLVTANFSSTDLAGASQVAEATWMSRREPEPCR